MQPVESIREPLIGGGKLPLKEVVFPEVRIEEDEGTETYAVLDGASIPDLMDHLQSGDEAPDFVCLYRGELEPDMAEVAPYLVRLEEGSPFTNWVLSKGWGKHWGIFVHSRASRDVLRRHFRKFLRVKSPEGKTLHFRFYDPRVLGVFLPTCNEEELGFLFGPVERWLVEGDDGGLAVHFALRDHKLSIAQTGVVPVPSPSSSGQPN